MFRRFYQEMQIEAMDKNPLDDVFFSLREVNKKLKNQESIDWRFVRLHLGITIPSRRNAYSFFDLCLYIFELLKKYQCRDLSIVADALQIYCFEFEDCRKSLHKAKVMTDILISNKTCCERNGLNFVAKLMKLPYKCFSFLTYEPMYDVIQMHILSREYKYLKFLLEFGVMYIPLSDNRSTWTHCFQSLNTLLSDLEKPLLVNPRDFQINIRKINPVSRQRMLAVFRAVELMLKSRDTMLGVIDYVICFRMAYETIPEPVITYQEVVNFLYYVLSGPSADEFIEEICKEYKEFFPESTEPLAPRSLKHLSRCQVRQNFREAGTFPFGIMDLNYPQALKNYILAVESDYMRGQYSAYFNLFE